MILPNEIRIGNLVYCGDKVREVRGVYSNSIDLLVEPCQRYTQAVKNDRIYQIPLTEEWLVKMGFKKVNNYGEGISFTFDNSFLILVLEDNNWLDPSMDVYIKGMYVTAISSVHQCQNLIFVLTGQELKIEL